MDGVNKILLSENEYYERCEQIARNNEEDKKRRSKEVKWTDNEEFAGVTNLMEL